MNAKASPAIVINSQVVTLRSAAVGDDYELAIWLPPGYTAAAKLYPTLYLLDSPLMFGFAVPIVLGMMWDSLVPEMIVVGIGKQIKSYDEWWPVRTRDYSPLPFPNQENSGQAATFLKCVRSEVLPLVDQMFHTDVTNRTLWGHSLGGAFALYTLFHEPRLFHRFIATSPAVVDQGLPLIDIESGLPAEGTVLDAHLFVSVGSLDQDYKPHTDAFSAALRNRHYRGLLFKTAIVEGYAHIAAGPPGFIQGLRAVFSE